MYFGSFARTNNVAEAKTMFQALTLMVQGKWVQ